MSGGRSPFDCPVDGCSYERASKKSGLCANHERRRRLGMELTDDAHIERMCEEVGGSPMPGYPGFIITTDGRIYTLNSGTGLRPHPLELRPKVRRDGYLYVRLRGKQRPVHRLVALTFLGPCPEGLQVRHLDGQRTNPRLENLTYGTPRENSADRILHGTMFYGEAHPAAKFTDAQVREAVELYLNTDLTQAEIGAIYGTSQQMVSAWVLSHRRGLSSRRGVAA